MPNNMILLETIALTQSAASVTFDNLPTSGYTDLKIVTSARGTVNLGSGYVDGILTFNGTTTGYSERMVYGLGGSAASVSQSSTGIKWGNWANDTSTTANTFGNSETYIPNYRSSNFKSVSVDGVQENNASGSAIAALNAGLWSNTAAITSITFTPGSGSFAAGSTFSLYGVAALGTTPVLAPKATGGNRIENDGTYWIHTFLTSGTFTPQVGLNCDYLVVAGGGGAGGDAGGGGGAGGYKTSIGGSPLSLTTINYAVTVGAGGAGGTGTVGTNGTNSVFSSITSTGGGAGNRADVGLDGGSGGGGSGRGKLSGVNPAGGAASPSGQGNAGGAGAGSSTGGQAGGGGGGAGAAGSAAVEFYGGAGGNGLANSISGSSVTYAGGGGGGILQTSNVAAGAGGSGGGGAGSSTASAGTAGTTNTGGGGGGANITNNVGGNGGSGIVIIRYPIA